MFSAVFSSTPLTRRQAGWLWLALTAVSLLPRLVTLNRYITPDELIWVYRAVQFSEALRAGAFDQTLVAGHPGVTTLWLGSLGIQLATAVSPPAQAAYRWITQLAYLTPDNNAAYMQLSLLLTAARLPVILVNSAGVLLATKLAATWRGRQTAAFLFLFLALDPFLIGLSSILHVDALLTTFATVSLLALFLALDHSPTSGWRYLLLSAVFAGLALITKSPALLLPPFAALLFFIRAAGPSTSSSISASSARSAVNLKNLTHNLPLLFAQGLIWLLICLLTAVFLFPALWSDPTAVLDITSSTSSRHIDEALRETFFLGKTTFNHGWHFYPIALAFRLGPLILIGLVMGASRWRKKMPTLTTLAPLLWTLLFILGISFAAKKFDRYLLPVIPMLALLAAFAWAKLSARWLRVAIVAQLAYWLFFSLYPLAAYNPLLGGPWVADRVMPIGWGENQSAAARWLSANGATAEETAVSGIPPTFAPFFIGQTLAAESYPSTAGNYLIFTRTAQQSDPAAFANQTASLELLHTVRYGGLAQAWIFRQPTVQPPTVEIEPLADPLRFAGEVELLAAGAELLDDDLAGINLEWRLTQPIAKEYLVRLALRDQAGNVWREVETLLLNEVYHPPQFWPPGETALIQYPIPLQPHLPLATYDIELTLFDAVTNAQLSVQEPNGRFIGTRVTPTAFTLPVRAGVVPEPAVAIGEDVANGLLRLYGHDGLPPRLATGTSAVVDFYWQANEPLPPDLQLIFTLGDVWQTAVPLGLIPSQNWLPRYPQQAKYQLVPPPTAPAGRYPLTLTVGEDIIPLGEIELLAVDRLFTLPDIEQPLSATFGDLLTLHGFALSETAVSPADTLELTLFWQANAQPERIYSTLLHLRDEAGNIVVQGDQWPGGLPTVTLAADQVVIDGYLLELPADLANGRYVLVVGLYDPESGQRLTTVDASGNSVDELPLPLAVIVNE